MGDAADYLFESGLLAKILHDRGECDDFCEYCDEEFGDDEEETKENDDE